MIVLSLNTAIRPYSIAVIQDHVVMYQHELTTSSNSEDIIDGIKKGLGQLQLEWSDLDVIAVCIGPGVYTGSRIGVTVAKTLAMTLKIKIIGVSALEALAFSVRFLSGLGMVMVPGRKNEVNARVFGIKEGGLMPKTPLFVWKMAQMKTIMKKLGKPVIGIATDTLEKEVLEEVSKDLTCEWIFYRFLRPW